MEEENCDISSPKLDNFDWRLRYVFGSSKIAALGEPLVQVNLHCSEITSSGKENSADCKPIVKDKTICIEMNKEELVGLLAALKEAEQALNS